LKDIVLTKEGYQKLKREIEDLSTRRRREIADRIKVAREFGDIAENAEYDAAKNEQGLMEAKIRDLDHQLKDPEILETGSGDEVGPGIIVTLLPKDEDEPEEPSRERHEEAPETDPRQHQPVHRLEYPP